MELLGKFFRLGGVFCKVYNCLQDWVQHVKQMVRSKVDSLRKTVESKRQGIPELDSVKECLKELQEKYVFVEADKAADNIVVCKRYYVEVICRELGLWPGNTSSDTYINQTKDPKETSGSHIFYIKSLGFKEVTWIQEGTLSDKLHSFCWTQKLQKTTYINFR